jgi:DNA polymerase I-like protein with 3'-5' exonuclease and polymerase domains
VLVGVDLSGLELRCLGHFMARYDGGAYAKIVVEGSAKDWTDVHSVNCRALGFDPKEIYIVGGKQVKGRDIAKTFIYAWMYGAGDEKIGSIVGKGRAEGKRLKALFLSNLPALDALIKAVKDAARRGYLRGLDGRILHVRHQHAALNTLLQSAGALIAKKAMVLYPAMLTAHNLEAHQVLWIHDEFQVESKPEHAEQVGEVIVQAMQQAGAHFKFRVPITGDYHSGSSWAATH